MVPKTKWLYRRGMPSMVSPTRSGPALSPIVPHSPPRASAWADWAGHTAKLIVCRPLRQYLDFCGLGFDAGRGELPPVFDIVFKQTRLTSQHRLCEGKAVRSTVQHFKFDLQGGYPFQAHNCAPKISRRSGWQPSHIPTRRSPALSPCWPAGHAGPMRRSRQVTGLVVIGVISDIRPVRP